MNYYNEFDPRAAAWLQELINEKLIPEGEVDTRSIRDVQPRDLVGYRCCHFFAGIGGWGLALRLAGWPEDRPVWTGSCPCQSFSCAGKQKGVNDPRHLWPDFFRLIRECRPDAIFGEQVEGAIGHGWLDGIQRDLEAEAYAVGHCVLGAHSVGAPHIRQRLFWVAHNQSDRHASGTGIHNGRGSTEEREESNESRENGVIRSAASGCLASGGLAHSEFYGGRPDESGRGPQGRAVDGRDSEACRLAHSQMRGQRADGGASGEAGHAAQCDTGGRLAHAELRRSQQCDPGERGVQLADTDGTSGRVGDTEHSGHEGRLRGGPDSQWEDLDRHAGRNSPAGFWSDFIWWHCRDGKSRRIPAESLLLSVADGVPASLDELRAEGGFPLCKKGEIQGRTMLLKGYGNAIVPELAATFIQSVMDII